VKSGPRAGWGRTLWHVLVTLLVLQFIASLTLQSARVLPVRTTFLCLMGCGGEELRDFLGNVVLFIPLGWVLRYWFRPRLSFWLTMAATVGIEACQAFLLTGRDPSLRDILTNAAGGAIGIWLYAHWREIVRPEPRASLRLAGIGFGTASVVLLLTALGLHPAGSRYPWFGHWANQLAYYAPFQGELKSVEIGDWRPPAGPIPDPNPLQEAIARDSIDVRVVAVNRLVTRPTALIFAVMDEYDNEMLFVGGAWRSVQFQARTRFNVWGLRGLSLRLPLNGSERGDTLDITGRVRPDAWQLVLRSRGTVDSIALPLTVGLGWATLLPAPLAIAYEWYVMNALWLAFLLAPAAYWLHRARPRRSLLDGAIGIGGVLLLVPLITGVAASTRSDWLGGVLGLGIGILLARRSLKRHPAT
jgi:VanZ family protein